MRRFDLRRRPAPARGVLARTVLARAVLVGALLTSAALAPGAAWAQQRAAGLRVTCFPDRPVVHPGESLTLRALAAAPGSQVPVPVVWRVSAGAVQGADPAIWSFGEDALGSEQTRSVTATVQAGSDAGNATACKVQVTLAAAPPASSPPAPGAGNADPVRSGRLGARWLLVQGARVPSGYGLVSHLLLARPPATDEERERTLRAIAAWLLQLSRSEELERFRPPSQINLTVLAVRERVELPEPIDDETAALEGARRLLAVYDFARARHLLDVLGQDARAAGPYLVAQPAGSVPATLAFDMSRAAPQLVVDWVAAFCALAAQERSWKQITLEKLALEARNFLAVAARDAPEVLKDMGEWVYLSDRR